MQAKISLVTETKEGEKTTEEDAPAPAPDDARAAAAAAARKRAEKNWEENKKRWRDMGVPKGLPAKK
jgi:hypothetical protein